MSEETRPQNYRAMMVRSEGDSRSHLGEPLITIDPKHIDARTRVPNVFAMATLATMAKWVSHDERPSSLTSLMDTWELEYKKKAISLDGKSREEYVKVASFVAVGQGDESGVLTNSLLNEGAKQLGGKATKTK